MTTDTQPAPKTISAAELKTLLAEGNCSLVDVREPVEFAEGHISGAVSIPLGELDKRKGELDRSRRVVVTCESGKRGQQACEKLRQSGFESVCNLEGGIADWRSLNLGVERTRKGGLPLPRQVQLVIGGGVLLTSILTLTVHLGFAYLSALAGMGLLINGITGWCGLAIFLSKMPWNRVSPRT